MTSRDYLATLAAALIALAIFLRPCNPIKIEVTHKLDLSAIVKTNQPKR